MPVHINKKWKRAKGLNSLQRCCLFLLTLSPQTNPGSALYGELPLAVKRIQSLEDADKSADPACRNTWR